jgi:hypothetical protein
MDQSVKIKLNQGRQEECRFEDKLDKDAAYR